MLARMASHLSDDPSPDPDAEVVRAFIALAINEDVRSSLSRCQERLKYAGAHVSWVRPGNIHLTLAFLGDLLAKRLTRLRPALDRVGEGIPPLCFDVSDLGTFGSARCPRVIWVGVHEESGALAALHRDLLEALRSLGFPVEKRPFRPHLTLGRVRSPRGVGELTSAMASAKNTAHGRVRVDHLLLMRSHLRPQGAEYSLLHTSPLTGAETDGRETIQARQ
jgi:2'-5' RNA ligase